MELKTYRARSIQEALRLVRRDLGPEAAILQSRAVSPGGMLAWLRGQQVIEVTASAALSVPSRLSETQEFAQLTLPDGEISGGVDLGATADAVPLNRTRKLVRREAVPAYPRHDVQPSRATSPALARLFAELTATEMSAELASELTDRVAESLSPQEHDDPAVLRAQLCALVADEIKVSGPIVPRAGRCHRVALVGPTGVGKTTTIAKLAAHFRLREQLRVGLIAVDTFRIAAVEQLRTYAEIVELPMEIAATPHEMRQALDRLANQDLVLLDTAGSSPRDHEKIQELQTLLAEAQPHEVHLVLSCLTGTRSLTRCAQRFAPVGPTSLLLTKLDETTGLGNLLPLLRGSKLPLSYVTDGQQVPDDIRPADVDRLVQRLLPPIEQSARTHKDS